MFILILIHPTLKTTNPERIDLYKPSAQKDHLQRLQRPSSTNLRQNEYGEYWEPMFYFLQRLQVTAQLQEMENLEVLAGK